MKTPEIPSPGEQATRELADSRLALLRPGDAIDRFTVLETLGTGGMGVVVSAYDPSLDRKVAIKIMLPDRRPEVSEEARLRLLREAQAMARLRHPNVITVYDVGTLDDEVFIAMELVEGETLAGWLKRGRRPWRDVVKVFVQAGRGLAAAHRAGLVHRDFKPDNVLLGDDGTVRVTDFGLAGLTAAFPPRRETALGLSLTGTGGIMGTPAYMAPEQHRREDADARADQFSFCVALHEGLHGVRPFAGETATEIQESIAARRLPRAVAHVPRWLRRIVLRGLAADPAERFPSIDALLARLEGGLRRRGRVAAIAAAAASLAAVGIIWGAARGPESPRVWRARLLHDESGGNDFVAASASRDGRVLLFATSTEVFVRPAGSVTVTSVALVPGQQRIVNAELSATGERAIVTTQGEQRRLQLWQVDLATGLWVHRAASSGTTVATLAPDGTTLAVMHSSEDGAGRATMQLVVLGAAADERALVTGQPGDYLGMPAWTVDGNAIGYTRFVPGGNARLEIVDARTGSLRASAPGTSCRFLEFLGQDRLLCAETSRPERVVELSIDGDRIVPTNRVVYVSRHPFEKISRLRMTARGILLGVVGAPGRILLLVAGEEPRTLPSHNTSDREVIGFAADGGVVFSGLLDTRRTLSVWHPHGRLDVEEVGELPLAIVNGTVITRLVEHGDTRLFRRSLSGTTVPLGTYQGAVSVDCAGDRQEPCVLLEIGGRVLEWSSETGAVGKELASMPAHGLGPLLGRALSHDGRTLAYTLESGEIVLVDLATRATARIAPDGDKYQYVGWDPEGNILATELVSRRLVRLAPDGRRLAVVLESGSRRLGPARVSADGRRIAAQYVDERMSFWWLEEDR